MLHCRMSLRPEASKANHARDAAHREPSRRTYSTNEQRMVPSQPYRIPSQLRDLQPFKDRRSMEPKRRSIMSKAGILDPNSQHAPVERDASHRDGFQIVSQRRVDLPSEQLDYWQQIKQEDTKADTLFPSLLAGIEPFSQSNVQSAFRAPEASVTTNGCEPNQANARPSNYIPSSQTSFSQTSIDWSPLEVFPSTSFAPLRNAEAGRLFQQPFPSPSLPQSSCVRPSVEMHPADTNAPFTPRPGTSGGELGDRNEESGRIKDIQESIHCFWLVSENRMARIQDDLNDVSTRLKTSFEEQRRIVSQIEQILPLQVQIAQKVVRAAEDRKLIFGRIKSLEESSAASQKNFQSTLEAMQAELRGGIESLQEIVTKPKRLTPPKPKSDAPVPTASTTATTTTSSTKSTKRPSPPRKKTSPQGAKKAKLVSGGEEDCSVPPTPPPSADSRVSPGQERARAIGESVCHLQASYEHQHHEPHQPLYQNQARARSLGGWQHESQYQSHSQPIAPGHRPSASFDQTQLQPRPHTAAPCLHDVKQSMGSIEMPLHK
ncbi:hypothetical protein PHSY_005457 [Pseudozyma hubeiensis SY62]|uniref:Uncharacterized protein n=1 Tax=Pseudozyma hubeiensis (strain SY62) TaxID=1305764 RepID=R9P957_PSEHS|nr:hypothetical protein PHSY_005457 [Pseudozyma hubeiensis SY62]GAC97869.1 hypothetical protein PHSY_005457 [Pseudozyma hubeiensis SY62]